MNAQGITPDTSLNAYRLEVENPNQKLAEYQARIAAKERLSPEEQMDMLAQMKTIESATGRTAAEIDSYFKTIDKIVQRS